MLSGLFKQGLKALHKRLPATEKTILFVCATKLQEEDFWADSATGRSLDLLRQIAPARLRWNIAYNNSRGLPSIYNAGLEQAGDADIVVFIHDDVWFRPDILPGLQEGLREFDVIGVVGNMRYLPGQPCWLYTRVNVREQWVKDDPDYYSGVIQHGKPDHFEREELGNPKSACEVLDGLLLAVDVRALRKAKVRFDERFDFDMYDVDFCRTARDAGLRLGSWPLDVFHESKGVFGTKRWLESYLRYLDKWKIPHESPSG